MLSQRWEITTPEQTTRCTVFFAICYHILNEHKISFAVSTGCEIHTFLWSQPPHFPDLIIYKLSTGDNILSTAGFNEVMWHKTQPEAYWANKVGEKRKSTVRKREREIGMDGGRRLIMARQNEEPLPLALFSTSNNRAALLTARATLLSKQLNTSFLCR